MQQGRVDWISVGRCAGGLPARFHFLPPRPPRPVAQAAARCGAYGERMRQVYRPHSSCRGSYARCLPGRRRVVCAARTARPGIPAKTGCCPRGVPVGARLRGLGSFPGGRARYGSPLLARRPIKPKAPLPYQGGSSGACQPKCQRKPQRYRRRISYISLFPAGTWPVHPRRAKRRHIPMTPGPAIAARASSLAAETSMPKRNRPE